MKRMGYFSSGFFGLMLLLWGAYVTGHRYEYDGRIPGWRDWGPYHFVIGAAIVLYGLGWIAMSFRRPQTERQKAARAIESLIAGDVHDKTWEKFLVSQSNDPLISEIQGSCRRLPTQFPAGAGEQFTSNAGRRVLQGFAERLRTIEPK